MSTQTTAPQQDLETLAGWGTENLTSVIAIESQSDEASSDIPSSPGQRVLSDFLGEYFRELGYATEQDVFANLLVTIPGNLDAGRTCPSVAFMVHMDTAQGTLAVPALAVTRAWDGSRVRYPENDRLTVTVERYPDTSGFLGDDLLHGPGRFPIGLDDKLGMAELMTLAQILARNPQIRHGELVLVFRPDEEIGRMQAVEGLAGELARRGVRYGYTIDGILPFEVNVENFNAARALVKVEGKPLALPAGRTRTLRIAMAGVNTHGAVAKPEGHLNSTVITARALAALGERDDVAIIDFQSDDALECNARLTFLVSGLDEAALDRAEAALLAALRAEIEPHAWKGAYVEIVARGTGAPTDATIGASIDASADATIDVSTEVAGVLTDGARRVFAHLQRFLREPAVSPLLAEESDGYQGYSNPYFVSRKGQTFTIEYRFRDFDPALLARRKEHVRALCEADGFEADIKDQYVNMGPKLAPYPELVDWAAEALQVLGRAAVRRPIRGGTGVDPFLAHDIPVANLGTGYFAPESEKELTSRQNIARHTLWLVHLVQVIAARAARS
jgi:di/tripeptidase